MAFFIDAAIKAEKLSAAIISNDLQGEFLAAEFQFSGSINQITLYPDKNGVYNRQRCHLIPCLLNEHLGITEVYQFGTGQLASGGVARYQTSGVIAPTEFERARQIIVLAQQNVAKSLPSWQSFHDVWKDKCEIHVGAATAFLEAIKKGRAFAICETSPWASEEGKDIIFFKGVALDMCEEFYDAIQDLANIALGRADKRTPDAKFYLNNGDADKKKIYEFLLAIQAVEAEKHKSLQR